MAHSPSGWITITRPVHPVPTGRVSGLTGSILAADGFDWNLNLQGLTAALS
jgi:hypothetical protein